MNESYYLQALVVLTEAEDMMKSLQVDYKNLVEKALVGIKKDMESAEKMTQDIVKILKDAADKKPEGALTDEELDDLTEDK